MKKLKKPKIILHSVVISPGRLQKCESSLLWREAPKVTLESLSEDICFEKSRSRV